MKTYIEVHHQTGEFITHDYRSMIDYEKQHSTSRIQAGQSFTHANRTYVIYEVRVVLMRFDDARPETWIHVWVK